MGLTFTEGPWYQGRPCSCSGRCGRCCSVKSLVARLPPVRPEEARRRHPMDERRALVVVDLLNGFFKNNPRLPDPVEAERLIRNNRRVIGAPRRAGLASGIIQEKLQPAE